MKRLKITAILLAFILITGACSDTLRRVRDYDDEEETETEETEDDGIVSGLPEASEPLSEEILEGTWVTDTGMLCCFDFEDNTFTDSYGVDYDILEVNDDSIEVCLKLARGIYDMATLAVPIGDNLTIEASYCDGELYILDNVAHNLDSDEGQEFSERLQDRLSGSTLVLDMGTSLYFDSDLNSMTVISAYGSESVDMEFTGYSVIVTSDTSYEMNLWLYGDDVVIIGAGEVSYATNPALDLPARFLYYDRATDYIELLDFTSRSPAGTATLETSAYAANIAIDDGTFVQFERQPGVYMNEEVMYQYSNDTVDNTSYLIDMRSPFAAELLRRAEVLDLDEGELAERRIDFEEGYVTVELYDNQWPGEFVSVYSTTEVDDTVGNDEWSAEALSGYYGVLLTGTNSTEEHPSVRVFFEYDGEPEENLGIWSMNNGTFSTPVMLETTFEDGYAYADVPNSAVYFFGTVDAAAHLTQSNFFDTDPQDTIFGRIPEYEDILSLVDMEYITESCNSVFVIDSAEDLASLTYYVNAFPREYDDNVFVYVDLIADIDISDYQWVPLGEDNELGFRQFSGIFAGNGHTISGLTIDNNNDHNGFFGDIYFSTVIGLSIEDAYITGPNSALFACDLSTTDFYDCHAQGELPNNFSSGSSLFHDNAEYGNNGFMDCSITVVNGSGEETSEEFTINLPQEGSWNELYALFCPNDNGNYVYDTDYFFGDDVPWN